MNSTLSVEIDADPGTVFRLARDVERWPALLPHYVSVTPLARPGDGTLVARMIARRPLVPLLGLGLPVAWRARTWAEPAARRLRFVHLGGATAGMDVTWRIEARGSGSIASIEHRFAPPTRLGSAWAALVERAFIRPIAGETLATFKALAEAISDEAGDATPSTTPTATPDPSRP